MSLTLPAMAGADEKLVEHLFANVAPALDTALFFLHPFKLFVVTFVLSIILMAVREPDVLPDLLGCHEKANSFQQTSKHQRRRRYHRSPLHQARSSRICESESYHEECAPRHFKRAAGSSDAGSSLSTKHSSRFSSCVYSPVSAPSDAGGSLSPLHHPRSSVCSPESKERKGQQGASSKGQQGASGRKRSKFEAHLEARHLKNLSRTT